VKDFCEIKNLIKENATLVLLKIDEALIPERIEYARKHRDKAWNDYMDKKGSKEEANNYYIAQQRLLLRLIQNSSLDRKIYDTSNLDFSRIAKDIVKSVL
jgi:uncharacterized protein (DUF952 family)